MKKGSVAKATPAQPLTGKKDASKPAGPGKVVQPYTPAGRKGKKK